MRFGSRPPCLVYRATACFASRMTAGEPRLAAKASLPYSPPPHVIRSLAVCLRVIDHSYPTCDAPIASDILRPPSV